MDWGSVETNRRRERSFKSNWAVHGSSITLRMTHPANHIHGVVSHFHTHTHTFILFMFTFYLVINDEGKKKGRDIWKGIIQ
jgi:hypothetical protein